MSETMRLVTAEELPAFQVDDYRYELVDGRVVRMNPPGGRHGYVALNIGGRASFFDFKSIAEYRRSKKM